MVNSRYRCFAATPNSSRREVYHPQGHTLSRSYGANLPNSLTRVLSSALVFSTHPPVSVWSTVTYASSQYAAFLGSLESTTYDTFLSLRFAFYSYKSNLRKYTGIHQPADLSFFVPALLHIGGAGIFTCFPSASPFGYTLGAD